MYNYSFISVTAFMAAQKTKIIHSFLVVAGCAFLLWTGGSLAMRMELWPGVGILVPFLHCRA